MPVYEYITIYMQVWFYLGPFHLLSGPSGVIDKPLRGPGKKVSCSDAAAQRDALLIKQTCDQLAPSLVLETWMQTNVWPIGISIDKSNCGSFFTDPVPNREQWQGSQVVRTPLPTLVFWCSSVSCLRLCCANNSDGFIWLHLIAFHFHELIFIPRHSIRAARDNSAWSVWPLYFLQAVLYTWEI